MLLVGYGAGIQLAKHCVSLFGNEAIQAVSQPFGYESRDCKQTKGEGQLPENSDDRITLRLDIPLFDAVQRAQLVGWQVVMLQEGLTR